MLYTSLVRFRGKFFRFIQISLLLLAAIAWDGQANADQLILNWVDNSTNEDGFKIERAKGTGGTFAQVATTGANVTSYTDSDLVAAITYCYRVMGFNLAGGSSYSNNACYTSEGGGSTPAMLSPPPGSTLTTSTVTFQWSAGSVVAEYWLGVGTTQAAVANNPWGDIFAQSTGTNTSAIVSGIPLIGNPVFVRLWWKIGTTWSFTDYTYQTQGGGSTPAMLSSPPGSTLTTSTVTFQWSAGSGVAEYWLGVGTSQAAIENSPWGDIFAQSTGIITSAEVSGIPLTGNPVFVRLWFRGPEIPHNWFFTDYTYQTQ